MILCLILSAGESFRFGSPKALAKLNENLLVIQRIQETFLKSNVEDATVVLGSNAEMIKPYIKKNKRIKFIINKNYHLGQTESVKVGLRMARKKLDGFMLLPIDSPFIKFETLNLLYKKFNQNKEYSFFVPTYKQRCGHPPIISSKFIPLIKNLKISVGLNFLLKEHESSGQKIGVNDSGIIETFNTESEFKLLKLKHKNHL